MRIPVLRATCVSRDLFLFLRYHGNIRRAGRKCVATPPPPYATTNLFDLAHESSRILTRAIIYGRKRDGCASRCGPARCFGGGLAKCTRALACENTRTLTLHFTSPLSLPSSPARKSVFSFRAPLP